MVKAGEKLTCGDRRLLPRLARPLSLRRAECRAGAPFYRLPAQRKRGLQGRRAEKALFLHPGRGPFLQLRGLLEPRKPPGWFPLGLAVVSDRPRDGAAGVGASVPLPPIFSPTFFLGREACGSFPSYHHVWALNLGAPAPTSGCGALHVPCFLGPGLPTRLGSTIQPGALGQWEAQWLTASQYPCLGTWKSGALRLGPYPGTSRFEVLVANPPWAQHSLL